MKYKPGFFCGLFLSLTAWFLPVLPAYATQSVWDVLRSQLTLNHDVTQPDVQEQLRWLVAHPSYLQKLARSEPYMYHIITEIKKRRLPGELALLPMIESAYDPFAYSGAGAAGLWQLMPGTGNNLGLKQDWWFDGRRSIRPSTDAALNYLTYLNKYFNGNWQLAIAAYDSGEGTISRSIKNSGQSNRYIHFWSLPLPHETKTYVPRLLALAEIIKYPQRYHVILPDIPHVPYFEEVNIGSQIDLNHAAKLAGISYHDLIKLNPGFNHWTTAPNQPYKLLIPAGKVAAFNRNLANVPEEKRVSWTRHQVVKGDSLASIAHRYSTTTMLLRELNRLPSDKLKLGQNLVIPSTKNAPAAVATKPVSKPLVDTAAKTQTYKVLHIVQSGDNWASLEKKYQVSSHDIRNWNKLSAKQNLKNGEQLIIWRKMITPGAYTIKSGDTLSIIAKHNNTTVTNLTRLNPKIDLRPLKPGQRILVG